MTHGAAGWGELDWDGESVYVVAEMSGNHLNDFERAAGIVEAAAGAGADAVKLQTYRPESLSLDVENEHFAPKEEGIWEGLRPHELYRRASTPWDWQPDLKRRAEELGLDCFSSPFDREAVEFMDEMGMPAFKIASLEINDLPLIEDAASRGKPVIISTGAADLGDIERAVNACRRVGNDRVVLLGCTSEYPAPVEKANLATIPHMRDTFDVPVGLSDHTTEPAVPIAAAALGARLIEVHLTLDRSLGGPDADFSLEPDELEDVVRGVREADRAVGKVDYSLSEEDAERRRSLFVVEDVREGEEFSDDNVRSIRPGHGLPPRFLPEVLGRRAARDVERGTPLSWSLVCGAGEGEG